MLKPVLVCTQTAAHIGYIFDRALNFCDRIAAALFRCYLSLFDAQTVQGNRRDTDCQLLPLVGSDLRIHGPDTGDIQNDSAAVHTAGECRRRFHLNRQLKSLAAFDRYFVLSYRCHFGILRKTVSRLQTKGSLRLIQIYFSFIIIKNFQLADRILFRQYLVRIIIHLRNLAVRIASHLEAAVKQRLPVELRIIGNSGHFLFQLLKLLIERLSVHRCERAGSAFHCQLVHSLQHIVYFCQCAVCCLDNGDTVVGILSSHRNTADLCIHSASDGITGRILLRGRNL